MQESGETHSSVPSSGTSTCTGAVEPAPSPVAAAAGEGRTEPWQDADNWNHGIYFCKQDDRLLVPKQTPILGWTVNFGHPYAPAVLIGLVLLPVAVMSATKVDWSRWRKRM